MSMMAVLYKKKQIEKDVYLFTPMYPIESYITKGKYDNFFDLGDTKYPRIGCNKETIEQNDYFTKYFCPLDDNLTESQIKQEKQELFDEVKDEELLGCSDCLNLFKTITVRKGSMDNIDLLPEDYKAIIDFKKYSNKIIEKVDNDLLAMTCFRDFIKEIKSLEKDNERDEKHHIYNRKDIIKDYANMIAFCCYGSRFSSKNIEFCFDDVSKECQEQLINLIRENENYILDEVCDEQDDKDLINEYLFYDEEKSNKILKPSVTNEGTNIVSLNSFKK